jgi:ferrous iron transport protein A
VTRRGKPRRTLAACNGHAVTLRSGTVKQANPSYTIVEGHCAGPAVCPLNQVKAGTVVCVKQLAAAPEVSDRLREMGLGEEQRVKLLSGKSNVICQVCNARVGLSEELAKSILVEPVPHPTRSR